MYCSGYTWLGHFVWGWACLGRIVGVGVIRVIRVGMDVVKTLREDGRGYDTSCGWT